MHIATTLTIYMQLVALFSPTTSVTRIHEPHRCHCLRCSQQLLCFVDSCELHLTQITSKKSVSKLHITNKPDYSYTQAQPEKVQGCRRIPMIRIPHKFAQLAGLHPAHTQTMHKNTLIYHLQTKELRNFLLSILNTSLDLTPHNRPYLILL